MSRARDLSKIGNKSTLAVDTTDNEVGIASTVPRSTLDVRGEVKIGTTIQAGVAGVLTATSFSGSGANLTGIADTATIVSTATTTGLLNVTGTTDSTSTTTGSVTIAGGVGIAKNVYIGAGLSVAGTLTYEDVTNVDSVGLITAKSGVNITGGELKVGTALTIGSAGVATFSAGLVLDNPTAGRDVQWQPGSDRLAFFDNTKATFGDGVDLQIFHNGTNSIISNQTGDLSVRSPNNIVFMDYDAEETFAKFVDNGAVELYYDGSKKFETTSGGAQIVNGTGNAQLNIRGGSSDGTATIQFIADDNAANDDNFRLQHGASNDFYLQNYASGSWETNIKAVGDGSVDLYHNNVSVFSTEAEGIKVLGTEGADAEVHIYADEGDDNQDKWKLKAEAGNGEFEIANYAGGSWETNLRCYSNNAVDLYYDGTVHFVTSSTGSTVKSPSHDGGLIVEAINNNQSTNIDIKAKSSGGTVYQKSLWVSRNSGDFGISDGSTTALTVANSTLVTTFRRGVSQLATAVSALDLDLRTSNYFTKTISGNSTFTFSNPAASGTATAFTLELTHSSGTVTWPSEVKWNADTAPTLTTGKTHLFMFVTDDG